MEAAYCLACPRLPPVLLSPHRCRWSWRSPPRDPRAASSGGYSSASPGHCPRLAAAPRNRIPANLGLHPLRNHRPSPSPPAWRRIIGDRGRLGRSPRLRSRLVVECSGGPPREERSRHGGVEDKISQMTSTVPKSSNIFWHDCPVGKVDRQKLIKQKGCVVWITGLSGSGKSTLACTLGRELHTRGKLAYVLDGDNLRHGLNKDLGFKAEDRAENIRRVGEVAKLFADAGLVCIASLISPYRRDRDSCRALLSDGSFIEVFLNMSLELCEARDPKGLYKLARAGKIKGFTGIDDPYEPPLNCEIEIKEVDGVCPSPCDMAGQVATYLEEKGFLHQ
ncbi:adenylyl-sulfate kinase 3-like isoform X2 [Phragmites australis]|uniref:adenylyl-sulfate kinase 3-like isoform X2 n=1 Tax=Phragmites australis TaxID=29695 RepID=UPI002D786962|nr:adenylyl-sulfate kinase 3-like isoform X2 [Phragmites australis]